MCFFFKQKTAYEMRISDWSSDVCSSDLGTERIFGQDTLRQQPLDFGRALQRGWMQPVPRDRTGHGADSDRRMEALSCTGGRSEERRVGKEWVSTCRSWVSPGH